jgi:S-DNA-T family DNA segregation ATPase FtsK/SpoIIIE
MSMDEQKKEKLTKELQGMALGTVGTFILLAFLTYNSADVSWNSYSNEGGIHNLGGRLGAQIADLFFSGFGLASYLIPLALLYMAYTLFRFKEIRLRSYKLLASCGLIFSLSTLFAFFRDTTSLFGQQVATGGVLGKLTCSLLKSTVGATGAMLLLLPLLAASIMILSKFSFVLFAGWWLENFKNKWAAWRERRAHNQGERQKEKARQEGMPAAAALSGPAIKPAAPPPLRPNAFKKEKDKKKEAEKTASVQETFEFIKAEGDFRTPPFNLLDQPPPTERTLDRDALTMNARLLEK